MSRRKTQWLSAVTKLDAHGRPFYAGFKADLPVKALSDGMTRSAIDENDQARENGLRNPGQVITLPIGLRKEQLIGKWRKYG